MELSSSDDETEETLEEDMLAGRQGKTAISWRMENFYPFIQILVNKNGQAFMYEIGIRIIYVCTLWYNFYVFAMGAWTVWRRKRQSLSKPPTHFTATP
jgi:hypothetical protein